MELNVKRITCLSMLGLLLSSCNNKLQAQNQSISDQYSKTAWTYQSTSHNNNLKFIRIAYDVVNNESHKLGSACNRFILRVLQIYGFDTTSGFIANDFDLFAKKQFKNYKAIKIDNKDNFDQLIASYPERTAFILQWERPSKHGHIALFERYQNKYYIYEASLNRYNPRIRQITADSLFNPYRSGQLTVYTDFLD